MRKKNRYRTAPGRRLILLRAKSKGEALLAARLMLKQVEENVKDNDTDVVQSLYILNEGAAWFG